MRFELSLITCGRPRMTLITGDLFILSLFLLQLLPAHALGYILAGTVATCDNEGEKVDIPFTLGNPCLNCECKNREVICIQKKCPAKMKNCGLVVRSPEECCGHCRECVLDGIVHNTSTSSSLINSSSCTLYSCQGGVLTKSTRRCVVPCTDPLKVHSRCCPLCPGCSFNGLEYKDGQHFSLHNDPCIKCRCSDRMVQCERNMCPLLPCFPNATYIPEGECCPRCNDQVRISDLQDGTCLLHNKVYRDGESINIDNCTSCVCKVR
uniref:VWFC domain-containing protein n=2 Tax=Eptatretus burgeri TaxID=7764 RepID=A0A8C4NKU7_EPTBU